MEPIDIADHLDLTMSWLLAVAFGGSELVLAALAVLHSRREARAASQARAATRGAVDLREGARLVVGRVEPLDGETAISVKLFERGQDIQAKHGWTHSWTVTAREVEANPFDLVTEGGTRVRVEPDTQVVLHDKLEITARPAYDQRERTAVLTRSERVAVTGLLRRESGGAGSGYRDVGSSWKLVRDAPRPMLASTEPLEAQPQRWATFYGRVAVALLVAFAVTQTVVYFSFYDYVVTGTRVVGVIVEHRTYQTTGRGAHTAYEIEVDAPRGADRLDPHVRFTTEIAATDYARTTDGDAIACIVTPRGRAQLGSTPGGSMLVFLLLGAGALVIGVVFEERRRGNRAWYEMRPIVTLGDGKLDADSTSRTD